MSITIQLPLDIEQRLTERAGRAGQSLEALACDLLVRAVNEPSTLSDILAPFRREVEESGIHDVELTEIFEKAREEVHADRRGGAR